jgi:hypothetical protein
MSGLLFRHYFRIMDGFAVVQGLYFGDQKIEDMLKQFK